MLYLIALALNFFQVDACTSFKLGKYQPAQQKYKCIYKGRDGYQRIKELAISLCILIGAEKTKVGSEVKIMTKKKDPETKQIVKVEFKFFWEEQIGKKE
ncbi:1013_t:CDS:2, partial [Gigaspora margarita]